MLVEEGATRLEYGVSDIQNGTIWARASVRPGSIRNQVWFVYRFDEGPWSKLRAERQFGPGTDDNFTLLIKVSQMHRTLSLYAIVRRGPTTIPNRVELAGADGTKLDDLIIDVDLGGSIHSSSSEDNVIPVTRNDNTPAGTAGGVFKRFTKSDPEAEVKKLSNLSAANLLRPLPPIAWPRIPIPPSPPPPASDAGARGAVTADAGRAKKDTRKGN